MKHSLLILFFAFSLVLLSACKKQGKDETSTPEYYFKGNLNGENFNWKAETEGEFWIGTSGSASRDKGIVTGELTAWISNQKMPEPELSISFKTFSTPVEYKEEYFNSFIKTGNWAFSQSKLFDVNTKEITVHYIDEEGKKYSSIGNQSGSSLTIQSVEKVEESYKDDEGLKIRLKVNCKLYPENGLGNSVNLQSGEAVLFMSNLL